MFLLCLILHYFYPLLFRSLLTDKNEKHQKKLHLVVAHYKEDLSYIDKEFPNIFDKIFIYSKSTEPTNLKKLHTHTHLPNIGRCDHTYLFHIAQNYDTYKSSPPAHILFLTGSCWALKRKKLITQLILKNAGNFNFYSPFLQRLGFFEQHMRKYKLHKYTASLLANRSNNNEFIRSKFENLGQFCDVYGIGAIRFVAYTGCFSVNSALIFRRDQAFYQDLLLLLSSGDNLEDGHFIERSWHAIFHPHLKKKENV